MNIETARLRLIPMTYEFVTAKLENRLSDLEKGGLKLKEEFWEVSDIVRLLPIIQVTLEWKDIDGFTPWLVILKESNRIIGTCGAHDEPNEDNEIEIGYDIDFDCRGQGYGTEAVSALTSWFVKEKSVTTINASCDLLNKASIAVLKKIGMKEISKDKHIIQWSKSFI